MKGIIVENIITGEIRKYRSIVKMQKDYKIHHNAIIRALSDKPFWKKELRHLNLKEY